MRVPLWLVSSSVTAVAVVIAGCVLWQTPMNVAWFRSCQQFAATAPDAAWAVLTTLGDSSALIALVTPALLLGRSRFIAGAFATLLIGTLASRIPKELLASPRPAAMLPPDQLHVIGDVLRSSSFPSGHTLAIFAMAAVAITVSRRPLLVAPAVLLVACVVAFSRIAVGAHWPADVLAGAGLGWLSGTLGASLTLRWRAWDTPRGTRIMALLLALNAVILVLADFSFPAVFWLPYLLGGVALVCSALTLMRNQPQAGNAPVVARGADSSRS